MYCYWWGAYGSKKFSMKAFKFSPILAVERANLWLPCKCTHQRGSSAWQRSQWSRWSTGRNKEAPFFHRRKKLFKFNVYVQNEHSLTRGMGTVWVLSTRMMLIRFHHMWGLCSTSEMLNRILQNLFPLQFQISQFWGWIYPRGGRWHCCKSQIE